MKQQRYVYMDYLRFFAVIAIIFIHISGQNWYLSDFAMLEWNICNVFNGISRWGVPVFVMLSGALFLEREIPIKQLYTKYILRLLVAYCVWSVFYATIVPLGQLLLGKITSISWKYIVSHSIRGAYHMWFIPMIVGLYMCIPIIKKITESKTASCYFLILSVLFTFVLPQIKVLSCDFIGGLFYSGIKEVSGVISTMNMELVLGFSFYFILGYWLNNMELTKKQRQIIYILGVLGFLLTIILNSIMTWKTNAPYTTYYDSFSVNVMLEAIAVHTWFKYRSYACQRMNKVMSVLSKCCFGAYLVHVFVIAGFSAIGLDTMTLFPAISVPVMGLLVTTVSIIISLIIHKIPVLNKWIV